jgi:DNA-directed RNA polymerase subunit beta'
VDAVQDIVVKEEDCGSTHEHTISGEEAKAMGQKFESRIFGRTLAAPVAHSKSGEVLAEKGTQVDSRMIKLFQENKVSEVKSRTIMTCKTENGICQMCYGFDLGTNKLVELGTAVGIIAAQSIGEPGTQLTMRTFHMGGVAEGSDITQGLTRVEELFEARNPKAAALLSEIAGRVQVKSKKEGIEVIVSAEELGEDQYVVPAEFEILVKKGEKIRPKQIIARSKTEKLALKATEEGKVMEIKGDKIITKHTEKHSKTYNFDPRENLLVKSNDLIGRGTPINRGHLNLQELMAATDVYSTMNYIMKDVQHIYASQGQVINDKHIEIIVKQMLSRVRIINPGDSDFLPGELINAEKFDRINAELMKAKKHEAHGERLLLGISRVAITTNSWLSAASFQETIRVLVEAATTRKIDHLKGLKENVIIGKLIPAGHVYRKMYEANAKIKKK